MQQSWPSRQWLLWSFTTHLKFDFVPGMSHCPHTNENQLNVELGVFGVHSERLSQSEYGEELERILRHR